MQVCGNGEAVACLQQWLASWQETAARAETAGIPALMAGPGVGRKRHGARNATVFSSDDEWLDDGGEGMNAISV